MKRYQPSFKPRSLRRAESKAKRNLILTVLGIILLVFFLINWGIPALIGSLSVFNSLKKVEKVEGVIEDTGVAPPVLNIPFEATGTATIKISGYASPNSKVEIYFDDQIKTEVNTNVEGKFTTEELSLSLGTNNIYGKTVEDPDSPNSKKSLASKNIRVIYNNDKPKLEISEPPDNHTVTGGDKKVRVSGKTDTDNSVTVSGHTVIINGDGNFTIEVPINEGENTISIEASNSFNNITKIEKKVTYKP